MRKLTLSLIGLFTAVSLFAQPLKSQDDRNIPPEPKFENLQKVLDLSDEQVASWKAMHEKQAGERQKQRAEMQHAMERMKEEHQKMNEERQAALQNILTKEQFEKLNAIRAEKAEHFKKGQHDQIYNPDKHPYQKE